MILLFVGLSIDSGHSGVFNCCIVYDKPKPLITVYSGSLPPTLLCNMALLLPLDFLWGFVTDGFWLSLSGTGLRCVTWWLRC